jgi:hypothetical protein
MIQINMRLKIWIIINLRLNYCIFTFLLKKYKQIKFLDHD